MRVSTLWFALLFLRCFPAIHNAPRSWMRVLIDIRDTNTSGNTTGFPIALLPKPPLPPSPRKSAPWGSVRFGMGHHAPAGSSYCNSLFGWLALGRDANLIKILAIHVGSPTCINAPSIFPNGTIFGAHSELLNGNLDVYGTSAYQIGDTSIRFLYPHVRSDACLLVQRLSPVHLSITHSFALSAWFATGVALVCFYVALKLSGVRSPSLETLRTFLSGSFEEKILSQVGNYVSLILCMFGVIILTAFSGCFMSFLTVAKDVPQVNTLEEANARLTRVHGNNMTKDFFKDIIDPKDVFAGLLDKFVVSTDHEVVLRDVVSSREAGVFTTEDQIEFYQRLTYAIDQATGLPLTHRVRQCIWSPAYKAFAVRVDWPHGDRFNDLLLRLVGAGIADKLHRDSWWKWSTLYNISLTPGAEGGGPALAALGPSEMREPAILLGCGLLLSAMVFLGEVAAKRTQRQEVTEDLHTAPSDST